MLTWLALVIICAVVLPPVIRNKEQYQLNDVNKAEAPGQFIKLDHGDVHYELTGDPDGPLVVLVHGFSAPSYMWDKNVPALVASGYRVLRFDLYGRGYSARPAVKYDKHLFVEQIESLTKSVAGVERFHIVGLSMGGAITSAYIAQFPHRLESVVYLAPFNRPIDIGPLAMPLIGKWIGYTFFVPSLAKNQVNDLVEPSLFPYWQKRFERQMQFKGFRHAIVSSGRYVISADPTQDYKDVSNTKMPKLLLWGTSDKIISIDDAPRVEQLLGQQTRLVVVEGGGHAMQYEYAKAVNHSIIEHLRESERATV
ncbi:alpha/beta fold hydrolase [Vibrio methylphosphonaticus]|uniref:alpha/beta fold hydrolase n=1 Tax=Vibrio methylphosphonaticus TaxID=2946866 RepID=UPI00202A8B18|nr:alpha/beta hydrolase [Vibrio methylphosphonaticus]MCL9777210.1 alpha/beta hydrolase [Vibrio methylphosphonaticus]